MMQGFYLLAVQRARRQRRIALAACALALAFALCAAQVWLDEPAVPTAASAEPYVAQSEDGLMVVTRGGETVLRTGIDVRTLPQADRDALADGIVLEDEIALARLLEDYGS